MTPTRSRRARGFSSPTAEARGARGHGPGTVAGNQTPLLMRSAGCSCSCERLASPWCLSFCPSLLVLCLRQPPPTLFTASTRVAHEAQAPPRRHHLVGDAEAARGAVLTAQRCPCRRPAARGRLAVPRGDGGHLLAAVGRAAVAVHRQRGAHVRVPAPRGRGASRPHPVTPPWGPGRASHVTARASGTLRALDGGRRTGCVSSWTPAMGRPPQPAARASGVAAP